MNQPPPMFRPIELANEPVRQLTNREIAGLVSGFIGVLANYSTMDSLQEGLASVLQNQLFWRMIEQQQTAVKQVVSRLQDEQLMKGPKV